jgi:mRNA interferase MazF
VNRGDLVTIALQGDYGKPRPALVLQSDLFGELPSVTILPITSDTRDVPLLRIVVEPSETNGLRQRSEIMVDKAQTVSREKIGGIFGHLDDRTMLMVNRSLALFLGLA